MLPAAITGAVFLLSLVLAASMMPVERLPTASWVTALGLGFVSAVFDNIPLTALALRQGGYDWGMLAYAVGFGGSMIWFGSSAGVAVTNVFPEAKSVAAVAAAWLARGTGLRRRLRRAHGDARVAAARAASRAGRSGAGARVSDGARPGSTITPAGAAAGAVPPDRRPPTGQDQGQG